MKKKILIVEDNTVLAYMIQKWLSREGYDTEIVSGELPARKLVKKGDINLVLSDVRLPEGDGISLLEWIQKEKMDVPFIVMTGYASVPEAVKAIKLGAKDYLAKLFKWKNLSTCCRKCCNLHPPCGWKRKCCMSVSAQGDGDRKTGREGGSIRHTCHDMWSQRNREGINRPDYP